MEVNEPTEIIKVDTEVVGCDGGGPLGHPLVYLNIGAAGTIDCPYCGQRFVLERKAHVATGH